MTKGTRIADGTTVAIKHIPKAKVCACACVVTNMSVCRSSITALPLAPSQVRHLQMLRNEISILKVVGEALVC